MFGGEVPRFDTRLIHPQAVALILGFLAIYFLSDGLRLYFVLRTIGARVKIREIFPLVFINILFSNATPHATDGGFAQVWYLQRHGVPVGSFAAATTIRTILAMLAIFLAAPLFQFLHPGSSPNGFATITLQSLSGFIVLYLIGFMVVLRRPHWIAALLSKLLALASRMGLLGADRRDRWINAVRRETAVFSASFARFVGGSRLYALAAVACTVVSLLTLFAFPALLLELTLPPTFIQCERDSGFDFCPFGRVGQRGLARSFADCAASGPVAGRRSGRTRRAFAIQGVSEVVRCYSPCAMRPV
jgi:uncharacterized protein (TIRG00374 family)